VGCGGVIFIEYNEMMENKKFGRTIFSFTISEQIHVVKCSICHGSISFLHKEIFS